MKLGSQIWVGEQGHSYMCWSFDRMTHKPEEKPEEK